MTEIQSPQPQAAIPTGWSIKREGGSIRVFSPFPGPGGTECAPWNASLASRLLYALCDALLQAPAVGAIRVEGPVNPGEAHPRYRCRKPGESLERYRIAMGWDKQTVAAQGWQPIKTAPKDGTHILVWTDASDTAYVVCWADAALGIRKYLTAESGAERGWHLAWDGELFDREHEPTHWMPLPDAPGSHVPVQGSAS